VESYEQQKNISSSQTYIDIYIGTRTMDSVTTGGLTFRWADEHLVMTTSKGQYTLDAQGTARLLDMLYANKDAIFDVEAHLDGLASWARQHPVRTETIANHTVLYRRFGVSSYKNIPMEQYPHVLQFLEEWRQSVQ
jgi:hypothetical protein